MDSLLWKLRDIVRETWRGKSIGRILSNWVVRRHCRNLNGAMIDLGGGERPSYERYWDIKPSKFIRVDIDGGKHPDVTADLNKSLPFPDNFADHIFLFSVLYILEDPARLFKDVHRVLKPQGVFWVLSPFLFPEAREPSDFVRFTSEGLQMLFRESGFKKWSIEPIGERGSAAASLLAIFLPFRIVRIPCYVLVTMLDRCVPRRLRKTHPAPLAYFCIGIK